MAESAVARLRGILARDMSRDTIDQLLTDVAAETGSEHARLIAFIERGQEQHMRFGLIDKDGTTTLLPCADWCYACKLEQLRATIAWLKESHSDGLDLIGRLSDERDSFRQLHYEAEQAVTRLQAEVERLEEAVLDVG